jgi:putative AlgH/UPF0301 family transcriptional regulator
MGQKNVEMGLHVKDMKIKKTSDTRLGTISTCHNSHSNNTRPITHPTTTKTKKLSIAFGQGKWTNQQLEDAIDAIKWGHIGGRLVEIRISL